MLHLILALMSIALFGLITVAAVSYTPTWVPDAELAWKQAAATSEVLEKSFKAYVVDNGAIPVPTAAADGGLSAYFSGYYGFLPQPPANSYWLYGKSGVTGVEYFCLVPDGDGWTLGQFKGIQRLTRVYSAQQLVIGTACGSNTQSIPTIFPVADRYLTLFVKPSAV